MVIYTCPLEGSTPRKARPYLPVLSSSPLAASPPGALLRLRHQLLSGSSGPFSRGCEAADSAPGMGRSGPVPGASTPFPTRAPAHPFIGTPSAAAIGSAFSGPSCRLQPVLGSQAALGHLGLLPNLLCSLSTLASLTHSPGAIKSH